MKKYSREDQRLLATWAADCAERVLSLFEERFPGDRRPRTAIEVCRAWVRTGDFSMAEIRGASLGAHAAAREVKEQDAARFATRSAGQAVATAHVPQHAYGAASYALKAVAAANPDRVGDAIARELEWQSEALPDHLRKEIMGRIIVQERKSGYFISIRKDGDF